jgi:ABC-type multidrug transport system fused ATPase/permease subunit
MGVIQIAFFIFLIIKYFLMHLVILNSNEQIHDEMIYGLIRSSSTYFDITPTGQLTNKFSNDMGILDNNMPLTLIETIEGPIVALVLFANVFAIDLFFLIPGVINLIVVVVYFLYCKDAIVASKQLYLRLKSPVYGMISEMISSLTQIRIFNRRMSLMKDFSRLIDKLFAGDMGFWLLSRAFGAYISYITIIVMIIAYIIGIRNVEVSLEDPNTTTSAATLAGLYGVSVVFLIQVNDSIQVFLRQMIFLESVFVSVERTFLIKNL